MAATRAGETNFCFQVRPTDVVKFKAPHSFFVSLNITLPISGRELNAQL
jgi:hypothetical protein